MSNKTMEVLKRGQFWLHVDLKKKMQTGLDNTSPLPTFTTVLCKPFLRKLSHWTEWQFMQEYLYKWLLLKVVLLIFPEWGPAVHMLSSASADQLSSWK